MQISRQAGQQILMGTIILLVLPMLIFPRQFGTELIKPALVNVLYELVFYAVILYFFNRRTNLIKLFQGAGFCLVYRLGVGLVLGAIISVSYSMKFSISTQLAMSSYLPGILFQILLTPFVVRGAVVPMLESSPVTPRPGSRQAQRSAAPSSSGSSVSISKRGGVVMSPPEPMAYRRATREPISRQLSPSGRGPGEINGFDRAVRYIGEHGSVYMAAVVDHEGLLLSQFKRGKFLPEDYAPLAQLLTDANSLTLYRRGFDFSDLERIDVSMKDERLIVFRHDFCTLVVVAERQSDDLLNIRVNQGMDTIAKYVEDRYPMTKTSNAENRYVPGTK